MKKLLTAGALLCLAACGTTVPQDERGVSQGPLSQDLQSATGGSVVRAPATGPSGAASQGATTSGPGLGSVPTAAGSRGESTTGVGASPAPVGAPVEVGFEYATGVTAFASALGISADVGDGSQQAKAIVAWVNAHGGLAGHRITPVFYALDLTRTDPYSQFMDEMCTLWTQDHHVVAAFAYANADFSPVARCLTQHHALFSSYAAYTRNQDDFRHSANWIETSTLSAERLAALQVASFQEQGFLTGQKKVGLLAYDYAQARTESDLLVARLKQRGITTVLYEVHYGGSTPELASTITSIQSAVLRFQSEGIQRVMSAAYPGAIAFFMRYADNQSYRPRYGLTSYDALAALPANAPVAQLHGAIAAGWWPAADLSTADRPALNAAGTVCRSVFTRAGIPATQDAASFGYCDEALSLQAAAALLGPTPLTGDTLRLAFERLGSSYTSPSMLGTSFGLGRHDGVAVARPLAFDDGCSCWRPKGPAAPIP